MGKKTIFAGLIAGVAGIFGYKKYARKMLLTWGATNQEVFMSLAGDELIPGGVHAPINMTQAITIDAPPEKIWPWIVQMGQDKAGFNSFDKLERICGFGIYNTYRIVPEWQELKEGDFCKFHKNGIGMQIVSVEKNKHIVMLTDSIKPMKPEYGKKEFILPLPGNRQMAFNWSFNLMELPGGKTRYLARCLATFDPMFSPVDFLIDFFAVFASCIMQIEQLRQIKQLAEGTHPAM